MRLLYVLRGCLVNAVYDIVIPQSYYGSPLALEGCYYNLRESDYIHWDQPWWLPGINDNATVLGQTYFAAGAYTIDKIWGMLAVFFNKNMLTDYGINIDLYQKVREGKWTLDDLFALAEMIETEGKYSLVADIHGVRAMLYGCDIPITKKDENDGISIVYYTEKLSSVYDRLYNGLNGTTYATTMANDGLTKDAFVKGDVLFLVTYVGRMANDDMRNAEFEYGVIPVPKYTEGQQAYISSNVRWEMMSVMSNAETERACIILEALNYASYNYVIPAFWESGLQKRYSRDPETIEMLNMIRNTVQFDFVEIFSGEFKSMHDRLPNMLVKKDAMGVSSWWQQNSVVYSNALSNLFTQYKAME